MDNGLGREAEIPRLWDRYRLQLLYKTKFPESPNMQIQIVFIYLFEKQANTDCDSVSLKQQKYLPIKLLEQNILKKKKKKKNQCKKYLWFMALGRVTKIFRDFHVYSSLVWNPPVHVFQFYRVFFKIILFIYYLKNKLDLNIIAF